MTETQHDGYERLLEDFGQRLEEAGIRHAGGQRHRRYFAAGTLVLAGIAAGTIMLTGVDGGERLDIVAQAKAALAPTGQVVHLLTTSHMEMRGGSRAQIVGPEAEDNSPRVTEQWSTSGPLRWRIASTVPIVTAHGTLTGPVQSSYGNGSSEIYIQPLNTLDITTGFSEDDRQVPPFMLKRLNSDTVPGIHSMLVAGQLHDAGNGTVNGHAVRRLTGKENNPQNANSPWPVEYDVDPATYAPVRITVEMVGVKARDNAGTLTVVTDVNRYEELPLNKSTASLLSIQPTGNPTIRRHRFTPRRATAPPVSGR